MKKLLHRLLLAVLLVAALVSLVNWSPFQPAPEVPIAMAAQKTDYYLAEFSIATLNASGELKHRLSGARLTHFPADDSAEIDALRLYLRRDKKPDWTISSARGWLSSGNTDVDLLGKVVMIRDAAPRKPGLRIDTDDMHLQTETHQITTDKTVTIVSAHWRARGVGMHGNTQTGDVSLLANVEFTYAPPQ